MSLWQRKITSISRKPETFCIKEAFFASSGFLALKRIKGSLGALPKLALLGLLVLFASRLKAGTCAPTSASITYEADDTLSFWINGHQVLNGSTNDPGNPPLTTTIPVSYFNAPGVADYFAAENVNNDPSYVGAGWVITITCADGATSYVTDMDSTYTMYDDINGNAPPPNDGSGNAWYLPAWVNPNPGVYFTQAPVEAPPIFWFNPAIVNPETGQPLQILSHSSNAQDYSGSEVLYFRESVVLPEVTPTVTLTPTISPTPYPTTCGTPVAFNTSALIVGGQPGNGVTSDSISFGPTGTAFDALLLVWISQSSGAVTVSGVTYGGTSLLPFPTNNPNSWTSYGGTQQLYYATFGGLSGNQTLSVNYSSNTNNQVVESAMLFSGVNQSTPFGNSQDNQDSNAASFNDTLTTANPYSMVLDLLNNSQSLNGRFTLGAGQNPGSAYDSSGPHTYFDYETFAAPGPSQMTYSWGSSGQTAYSWMLELRQATCSSSPTDTPTSSFSATPSSTPSKSSTPSSTLTPSPSSSKTSTPSPSSTPTDSPSDTPSPSFTKTTTPTVTPSVTISSTLTSSPSSTSTGSPSDTASPSFTKTTTPTVTPSVTISSTPSSTATKSVTPSFSNTPSPSPSFTATASPSSSLTNTPSRSPTDTPTVTPSFTVTLSSTPSATVSSTLSPSDTPSTSATKTTTPTPTTSPSQSPTATVTYTFSPGPSPTPSDTPSVSPSATPSLTLSPSPSATPTSTASPSQSPTATVTYTFSPGPSPTPSDTPSVSPSATPSLTLSPSPSATPTSTATPSATNTNTLGSTPSDTASPSVTPSATETLSFSSTPSPSATPTGSLTSTATPSPQNSPSDTPTRSPSASPTPSFTPPPTATVTPTPATLAFQIVVNIYNSAGEVVDTLYNGPSQSQAGGFTISGDLLMSGSSSVTLTFQGLLSNGQNSLSWSGLNNGLQPVSGGIYLIKVQQKDSFGDISSWTQAVNVLPPAASQALKIFNSAGELVDSIDLSSYGQVNDFALQSSSTNQNSYVISSDGSQAGVTFILKQPSNTQSINWNGLNGQGQEVASGTYMAELVTTATGGASVVDSKSFTVLDTEGSTPKIIEGPNPVGPKDTAIVVNYSALSAGEFASLKLYDLAGQLVGTASAPSGAQSLTMAVGHWAPGIYIGVFEVHMGGGVVSRQFLHIAMER